jgi:hypothetical protein
MNLDDLQKEGREPKDERDLPDVLVDMMGDTKSDIPYVISRNRTIMYLKLVLRAQDVYLKRPVAEEDHDLRDDNKQRPVMKCDTSDDAMSSISLHSQRPTTTYSGGSRTVCLFLKRSSKRGIARASKYSTTTNSPTITNKRTFRDT